MGPRQRCHPTFALDAHAGDAAVVLVPVAVPVRLAGSALRAVLVMRMVVVVVVVVVVAALALCTVLVRVVVVVVVVVVLHLRPIRACVRPCSGGGGGLHARGPSTLHTP